MLDGRDKHIRELRLASTPDIEAFKARIRELIAALPYTKAEVAERLGVTPQAVTGWETKGRISRKSLAGLAALADVSVDSIMGAPEPQRPYHPAPAWEDIRGYAQAVGLSDGVEAQEYASTHKLKFRADSLARKRLNHRSLAVMYGQGDSMLPRIREGDAILFDTSDTRPRDEALFVIQTHGVAGNAYSVKRCRHFGEDVYFDALNPEGDHQWRKPRKMDDKRHPITIIGRVRWLGSWED